MSTDDPRNHPCATCKAKPGQHCHDRGRAIPEPHIARRRAAENAWLWANGYEPIHKESK